jgi:hypothetical protein
MSTTDKLPEVLTSQEVAAFLRVSEASIRQYATRSWIPGRQIAGEWRFWRTAIEEWLTGRSGKEKLLSQVGALEVDANDLEALRESIYMDRGRSESEETG